jgi:hypothetical protein
MEHGQEFLVESTLSTVRMGLKAGFTPAAEFCTWCPESEVRKYSLALCQGTTSVVPKWRKTNGL